MNRRTSQHFNLPDSTGSVRTARTVGTDEEYDPARPSTDSNVDIMPVAFLGTYSPRRCGIATFTRDIARAVTDDQRISPVVVAVTDPSGHYQYPSEVRFEIRQNVKADYARAAEFVNYSSVRLVCIQHEYGIFGGDDGAYLLDFTYALRVPAVVTLHTVLKNPSANQAAIVRKLWERCARLVVMSEIAKQLLAASYGISGPKVRIIPHGIPVLDRGIDREALKTDFGVAARRLVLTFGLLSRNKGIETVIRALPAVVRRFPDVMYFVVGATHPAVVRHEGEAYRILLEREAERLGVRDHVAFRGQFVANEELYRYLQAADIFVSPYLNEAQVTSGALSYAMGAGAAVVSTPYWHAQELLAGDRGRLFPFNDHEALSQTLLELFCSPSELTRIRDVALQRTHEMGWPQVGAAYRKLMSSTVRATAEDAVTPAATQPLAVSSLPDLSLDHLFRMTDDTGIIQHAAYSVPARRTGYCVDDNARALIVAVRADDINADARTRTLVTRYLSYLHGSQWPDGSFRNFMSYERVIDSGPASDDCIGRAVWALGVTASMAADDGCRMLAREMLARALPHTRDLGPRGSAQVALGLSQILATDSGAIEERQLLDSLVAKLLDTYRANATDTWRWFESTLTYDNAILPLALFAAYSVTGDRDTLHEARASLEFLEEICFHGDQLQLVGNTGWHSAGGAKAHADEQAIDATALVLALSCAYRVTKERRYLRRMHEAFAWFLGSNRLGVPLYDFATGGCHDGIGVSHVNRNQGAESTVCFLMALLEMLEVDAGKLEHPSGHPALPGTNASAPH